MHTAPIHGIAADKTGRLLVTASADKTARIWDLTANGEPRAILRPPIAAGREGALFGVAMSGDGRWVATGGATGRSWDSAYSAYLFESTSGQLVRRISGLPGEISDLAFSSDGQRLVICMNPGGLRVHEVATGRLIASQAETRGECSFVDVALDDQIVSSWGDGMVRIHDGALSELQGFRDEDGARPRSVRFSPDSQEIAVAYEQRPYILVRSVAGGGRNTRLYGRSGAQAFHQVVWWAERNAVCAVGNAPITCWGRTRMPMAISSQRADGAVVVKGALAIVQLRPHWSTIDPAGRVVQSRQGISLDFQAAQGCMKASKDLSQIQICYLGERQSMEMLHFNVQGRTFGVTQPVGSLVYSPLLHSAQIDLTGFGGRGGLRLNGRELEALRDHAALSADIDSKKRWFAVGTYSGIFRFDPTGRLTWQVATPAPAMGILISLDGSQFVVAYLDGTVRWHNAIDGRELLTLFATKSENPSDALQWVLWTPAGYYDASSEAERFVAFHVNHGPDLAGELIPVEKMAPVYRRPDIVSRALSGLSVADTPPRLPIEIRQPFPLQGSGSSEARRTSEQALQSRLHVLAIGVASYQSPAVQRLRFSAEDAQAVTEELRQQSGRLYQDVDAKSLVNEKATRTAIVSALHNLSKDAEERDVSIIYFAGHAQRMTPREEYIFLPHDFDSASPAASAVTQAALQEALHRIPGHRVLILDTCYAEQAAQGLAYRSVESPRLEGLLRELQGSDRHTVVLMAAKANQPAQERLELRHGVFTAAFLEILRGCPLSPVTGSSQSILASMRDEGAVRLNYLRSYLGTRVRELTQGDQTFKDALLASDGAPSDLPLFSIDKTRPCEWSASRRP